MVQYGSGIEIQLDIEIYILQLSDMKVTLIAEAQLFAHIQDTTIAYTTRWNIDNEG